LTTGGKTGVGFPDDILEVEARPYCERFTLYAQSIPRKKRTATYPDGAEIIQDGA
jgi:hypothetical protein